MQHKLINLNSDLKRLWDDGLEVEILDGHLLVHHIPYVNSNKEIMYGTIISVLSLSGDITIKPNNHVIYFIGENPCNKDGSVIRAIQHASRNQVLSSKITVNHSFSNKPHGGYKDHYEKMNQYIAIISAPAKSIDNSVTEKTYRIIEPKLSESVFNYLDTNSTRAEIYAISSKFENQKIAIIGLGGTGSYILDLVAKTPVQAIHLFDGDTFLQHNAFRAPGAPNIDILRERIKKTDYFKDIYSNMHRNIISHDQYITETNVEELSEIDFAFLCLDKSEPKKIIIDYLEKLNIQFIDVGMGIHNVDNKLTGIIRITSSTKTKRDHIREKNRISFSDGQDDEYAKNIQIADLNSLNASLAVIKWKKISGFYYDFEKENNSTYTINVNQLLGDDHDS